MMTMTDHAIENARAWMDSIREMVHALDASTADDGDPEEARQTIEESALSVEVRSAWHTPSDIQNAGAAEYCILLTTGGPALRIIGTLGAYSEPEDAQLEYQDWGTPWTEAALSADDAIALLTFARQFYFGE